MAVAVLVPFTFGMAAGVGADLARCHLHRRHLRRRLRGDPAQYAGHAVVDRDDLRRLSDGARRQGRSGADAGLPVVGGRWPGRRWFPAAAGAADGDRGAEVRAGRVFLARAVRPDADRLARRGQHDQGPDRRRHRVAAVDGRRGRGRWRHPLRRRLDGTARRHRRRVGLDRPVLHPGPHRTRRDAGRAPRIRQPGGGLQAARGRSDPAAAPRSTLPAVRSSALSSASCQVRVGRSRRWWRIRRPNVPRLGARISARASPTALESWSSIALAKDWFPPSRLQNTPSWHYVHSDQWRYEKDFTDYHTVPQHGGEDTTAKGHTMDMQVRAVRQGWLPFYPQFPENPLDVVKQARAAGAGLAGRNRGLDRRAAEEQRDEVLRRGSRRRGELAARVVHLARQRAHGQCQGPRVFPAALSGHARQRGRQRPGARLGQGGRLARACAARERWTWSSISTSAWIRRRSIPTSSCRPPRGTKRRTSTRPTCTASSTRCRRRCRRAGSRRATGRSSRKSPRSSPSSPRSTSRTRWKTSSRRRWPTTRPPRSLSPT